MTINNIDSTGMNMRERVVEARRHMGAIFGNKGHADYFLLDTDVAARYGISTPTVRKIRRGMGAGSRDERIMEAVARHNPLQMTIDDMLCAIGPRGVTYHGLYMLLRARGVVFMRKNKG